MRFAQSQASKSAEDLHLVKVAEEREKQFHSLTKAVVLNMEGRPFIISPGISPSNTEATLVQSIRKQRFLKTI